MGPKKKGSKASKGPKGTGGIIDGVSTSEMSREQLEEFAMRIRDELEREREERNFFQLERDKLHTFWEITREQLEEKNAEIRNKERAIEEASEKHEMEIKIFKQKVKHILYEYQNNLSELKAENMVTLKMAESDHNEQELELHKDKMVLKEQLVELELAHQEEIKALSVEHSKELSELREQFSRQYEMMEGKMDKRLTALRNQLTLKHKMELTEVEERKNSQISLLVDNHQQAFTDLKSYYNDITLNNLALISSLKEQMTEVKKNEDRMEKKLREVMNENKKLVQPLQDAEEQVAELQRQLANYEKDKVSLNNTKKHLSAITRQLEDLTAEHDVLELTLEKVKSERDELHDRFVMAIMDLQQKCSLKNIILEKKLSALNSALEQRDAQIAEVMTASNVDPKIMHGVNRKLEDLLGAKNSQIQELQLEVARVSKAHDDMVEKWQNKLEMLGVPKEQFQVTPLYNRGLHTS